jgi:DNA-binding SARP family transcriptional activator
MLKLLCLGGLQIVQDDQPVTGFISSKAQGLLCYLALADGPRLRTELASLFWSEKADSIALKNLRMALSNLRNLLERYLVITRRTVTFNRSVPHWVDAEEFLQKGRNALRRESAAMLAEAMNLYKVIS